VSYEEEDKCVSAEGSDARVAIGLFCLRDNRSLLLNIRSLLTLFCVPSE